MEISSPSCYSLFGPGIFISTLFSNALCLYFLLNMKDQGTDYKLCYGGQPSMKCSVNLLNSMHSLQSCHTEVIFRLLSCGF